MANIIEELCQFWEKPKVLDEWLPHLIVMPKDVSPPMLFSLQSICD
jgi:hypothetical protein